MTAALYGIARVRVGIALMDVNVEQKLIHAASKNWFNKLTKSGTLLNLILACVCSTKRLSLIGQHLD